MSDHPNEAKKVLRQIFICNDVLLNVFERVGPAVLGLSFALVSARFDWIVDSHIASRRWALDEWEIRRKSEGTGAELVGKNAIGNEKHLPMPEVPPPDNVIGFKKLTIRFVDQSVLAFLCRISPRLFSNHQQYLRVLLNVMVNERNSWSIIASRIWPLLAQNVFCLTFSDGPFDVLRRLVSYSVLTDCARLQIIPFSDVFPQGTPSDSSGATSSNAFYKWLLTPHAFWVPKMVYYRPPTYEFVPTVLLLKEQFINATTRSFFVIGFLNWVGMPTFSLVNERTWERMRLYKFDERSWALERAPTAWGEKQWDEWSAGVEKVRAKGNKLVVQIGDEDVDKSMLSCMQVSSD